MARDEPIGGELLTLAEAAKTLPHRVDGSTLWRWWKRGIKGVTLRLEIIGGRRFVSRDALREFLDGVRAVEQSGAADRWPETRNRLDRAGLLGPKSEGADRGRKLPPSDDSSSSSPANQLLSKQGVTASGFGAVFFRATHHRAGKPDQRFILEK